jgi:multidrug transporter EmrE-like cation transporter
MHNDGGLAIALKSLPFGKAYAVWIGIGATGSSFKTSDWICIAC